MEIIFWILLIAIGVILLLVFGQHRNRFDFYVERVCVEETAAFVDGLVREGWIGLSQDVFFKKNDGIASGHVIGIRAGDETRNRGRKGDRIRLIITGKYVAEIELGSVLSTSKSPTNRRSQ